jgi:hypothetical protein
MFDGHRTLIGKLPVTVQRGKKNQLYFPSILLLHRKDHQYIFIIVISDLNDLFNCILPVAGFINSERHLFLNKTRSYSSPG